MKFTILKDDFLKAVSSIAVVCPKKPSIAALKNILLSLNGGILTITATDLELTCSMVLEVMKSYDDGAVSVNAAMLTTILKKFPAKCKEITIEQIESEDSDSLEISSNKMSFIFSAVSGTEYPTVYDVDMEDAITFQIGAYKLKDMIQHTLHAIALDDTRPVQCGALFEAEHKTLNVVGVDGVRIALRSEPIEADIGTKFVVPLKALKELLLILPKNNDGTLVTISVKIDGARFAYNGYVVLTHLLEGDFFHYRKVLDFTETYEAVVGVHELIDAAKNSEIVFDDKNKSPLRLLFTENKLTTSCKGSLGAFTETVDIEYTGADFEIFVYVKYLIDALNNVGEERAKFQFTKSLSPIRIKPELADNYTALVLPVNRK